MPFPRKCKHCACYIADQLSVCPRCGKKAPPLVTAAPKLSREERDAERAKLDVSVPVIHGKNMQWVPSALAVAANERNIVRAQQKLYRADTARGRNAARSEIRYSKRVLARTQTVDTKYRWTYEFLHTKHSSVCISISPKGHRYVPASANDKADLIIKYPSRAAFPFVRLQRFEKSHFARMIRQHAQEDAAHVKHKKAKKERREQKHKLLSTLRQEKQHAHRRRK